MKRLPREVVLPQGRQLWRLNEQGLLRLELSEEALQPGAEWTSITHAEAKAAIGLVLERRWHGLDHFPARGEAWRIVDGVVVPVDADPGART